MMLQLFSVFDSAARAYLQPFFAPTVEMAIRQFREVCNQEGHQFCKFADDYTLFHLGEFNQETGELVSLVTPHSLGIAITFQDFAVYAPKAVNDGA